MGKERLSNLLQDATADCHDGGEQFWGLFYTLAEQSLNFAFKVRAMGDVGDLVDLDGAGSGLRRGIVALVRKGDKEHPVALAQLELVDPDPVSAEWLAVYRYWLELR